MSRRTQYSPRDPRRTAEHPPWIALLGWLPPVYVIGLFIHAEKSWVWSDWGFDIGGNVSLLWWPTQLYRHQKRVQARKAESTGRKEFAADLMIDEPYDDLADAVNGPDLDFTIDAAQERDS